MRLRRRRTRTDKGASDGPAAAAGFSALVDREWARMAAPGTWWSGAQRVAIAGEARAAMTSATGATTAGALPPVAAEAARRVAAEACSIRESDVKGWDADGLDPLAYVELVGVVSRLAAVDVATFGLGLDLRPLPDPTDEQPRPSGETADDATVNGGWVPTVGPASAPSALTAVPPEHDAMFEVSAGLYMSIVDMGDLGHVRDGLDRAQTELVAARTSWLNECFY